MGYAEEKKEMFDEIMSKKRAIQKEWEKADKAGLIRGLDSEFDAQDRKVTQEYNRRLKALKEKYGIK